MAGLEEVKRNFKDSIFQMVESGGILAVLDEIKRLTLFCILLTWCHASFTQSIGASSATASQEYPQGLEIIFVVDVSYSMKDHIKYVTPLIQRVFKDFSDANNTENNFHLITFADYATYIGPVLNPDSTTNEIQAEMQKTRNEITRKHRDQRYRRYPKIPYRRQNTYPKSGLWEVFTLMENNFIQKRGVLIFISDGEDSRSNSKDFTDDIKAPIKALENTGFSTFSFFVDTRNDYTCEEKMQMIGECGKGFFTIQRLKIRDYGDFKKRVRSLPYNTPVSFKTNQAEQNKIHKELKILNENNTALRIALEEAILHNSRLKFERHITQFVSRQLEMLKDNLARNHALYSQYYNKSNSRPPSWTWFVIVLLLLATAFFAILWFHKEPPPKKNEQEQQLDVLWGRLIPMNKGFKTINLGDINPDRIVTLPRDFPDLKFVGYNQNGRKAIRIVNSDPENWNIRIYSRPTYKKIKSRNFIDEDTERITIKNKSDETICCTFKYELLNRFQMGCKNPVWIPGEFLGREDIIKTITKAFLNNKSAHSFLISGFGNTGKTSLLKHLYHEVFGKNKIIDNEYAMAFIAYDDEKRIRDFEKYKDEIDKQLDGEGKKPRKIIFIDQYDDFLDDEKLSAEFIAFLRTHDANSKYYYIFSGRKGFMQIEAENQLEYIPDATEHILLSSFEDSESIAKGEFKNSIKFLNSMLQLNGFPKNVLTDEAKIRIVTYASGFPFIIKELLLILIKHWLYVYDAHPLDIDKVDQAALKIKETTKEILFSKIRTYEKKKFPRKKDVPKVLIQVSEILFGLIHKEDLKNETDVDKIKQTLIKYPLDEEIQVDYEKIVPEQMAMIEEMGFISIVNGRLIRLPFIIFSS